MRFGERIAVVVFDGFAPFEMAVPCEVWGIDRVDMGVPRSEVRVCSTDASPLSTGLGFSVVVDHGMEALRWADTILIPAPPKPFPERAVPSELIDALWKAHRRGARIASLCSGAFVLGAAGLLDGRRATTHWMYTDLFRQMFPHVELDPAVLYVDNGSVLTGAGTAASIDLCLHLVRMDRGAEVANTIARRMVVPPHRDGGQAQFTLAPVPRESSDDDLRATLAWAAGHLDHDLSVDSLAKRAAMSPRTFARRFKDATGTTPLQWVLHQRVARAQHLLEVTDLGLEEVAERCGFGTSATLRQHFHRVLGTTPGSYRQTFGGGQLAERVS
ncbi:MAG: helix-turn-helix domain-containing protein [Ilumatobacteraceae bacterium]